MQGLRENEGGEVRLNKDRRKSMETAKINHEAGDL